MSRLDELPPDQRAALSVLLRARRTYAEVAAMLSIPERAVHDRAQAALVMLAPAQARGLTPEQRLQVGDYLLGQQPGVAERLQTRALLSSSESARAWALALSGELAHMAGASLPDVPDAARATGAAPIGAAAPAAAASAPAAGGGAAPAPAAPPVAQTPAAPGRDGAATPAPGSVEAEARRVSRVGGAVVLVLLVAALVGVVVAVSSGGSGKASTSSTQTKSTSTGPTVNARLPLTPVNPRSRSIGLVEVISEGSRHAFYMRAEHMAPTRGFFYALWLTKPAGASYPLGRSPAVGPSGVLEGGNLLPANAAEYPLIVLTRETTPQPSRPGRVVLHGAFSVGAQTP